MIATTPPTQSPVESASASAAVERVAPGRPAAIGFLIASAVALLVAVRLPLDVLVFGLLVLGVAHLGFEVRYITGRYRPLLHGRLLIGVSASLVLIILGRLFVGGAGWTVAEILLLAGTLAAVVLVSARRPARRVAGVLAIAAVAAVALFHAQWWFVTQAWLHNVIPVVFLWQWSARVRERRDRQAFRAVTGLWVVVIPVALLVGEFDAWLQAGSAAATSIAADAGVTATVVPVSLQAAATTTSRLIAVFAFLQLLHYTVWLWHFPRTDRQATRTFEATPVGDVLRGWRLAALMVGVSALLAVAAWADYRSGRGMYTSLAAYHAYLEYPVLLALALGLGNRITTEHIPAVPSTKEPR